MGRADAGWAGLTEPGERPDRGAGELGRRLEVRRGTEVEEGGQRVRGRVAPGERRQVPLVLDRRQDRGVVVDHRGDVAGLGERGGDQARDTEPVPVIAAGLVRGYVDVRRDV